MGSILNLLRCVNYITGICRSFMRSIKFKQEKRLKNMTSININKEKFGQLIHKEKLVLYRDGKAIDANSASSDHRFR